MATYVMKVGTFESGTWTGDNTEEFKAWVEPFLLPAPDGFSRVWDVIDNDLDPENVIVDGTLRAHVPGQTMSPYRNMFIKHEVALAGPLFDGQPSAFGLTSMNIMSPAVLAEQYEEI